MKTQTILMKIKSIFFQIKESQSIIKIQCFISKKQTKREVKIINIFIICIFNYVFFNFDIDF